MSGTGRFAPGVPDRPAAGAADPPTAVEIGCDDVAALPVSTGAVVAAELDVRTTSTAPVGFDGLADT
jgi:hypothetical protein